MKKKIPVGATIAHAYRTGVRNCPALIRAIWLPLVLYLAIAVPIMHRTSLMLTSASARDPSVASLMGPLLLFYPLIFILFFMQVTAATEVALEMPITSRFYFPFGKKLWRLIGGYLLALVAILALMILYLLAIYILGWVAEATLKIPVSAATARVVTLASAAAVILLGYGGIFFLAVRFFFLLAPASISGHRLGVARSWVLTRGNFWRAFLVTLAVLVPVGIVQYGLQIALAGVPPMVAGASAEAAKAARLAWQVKMLDALAANWFITLPIFVLMILFYLGVGSAAQAFAYRKLTEDDGLAPIAGD